MRTIWRFDRRRCRTISVRQGANGGDVPKRSFLTNRWASRSRTNPAVESCALSTVRKWWLQL